MSDAPADAATQLAPSDRIRPETARQLVQDDVLGPVKTALEQLHQVRSVLKGKEYRERARSHGGRDPVMERIEEAITGVEARLQCFRQNAKKAINRNRRLRSILIVLLVALCLVGLCGLVFGILKQSVLIIGSGAVFASTAIYWPIKILREIDSETIELLTLPDIASAGLQACRAKLAPDEIAGCLQQNLERLVQYFERLDERSKA